MTDRATAATQALAVRIGEAILQKIAEERIHDQLPHDAFTFRLEGSYNGRADSVNFGDFEIPELQNASVARPNRSQIEPESASDLEENVHTPLAISNGTRQTRRIRAQRRIAYDSDESETTKRRKLTGGLRLARPATRDGSSAEDQATPETISGRQLQSNGGLPQRKRTARDEHALRPSSLNKLITSIWEQIFSSMSFDVNAVVNEWRAASQQRLITDGSNDVDHVSALMATTGNGQAFSQMNILCRKITQASRVSRALEVIVQARWVEYFDTRTQIILSSSDNITATKARMQALAEACHDFGWTEKELRNKMAIWRGYKELKDAGGWAVLVFAGNGIYRFCKYRVSFDNDALNALKRHRSRFEVAADTLHPHWREMLTIIDAGSPRLYTGHPHDWVVSEHDDPIPLAQTYLQWDPSFTFSHLDSSIVDVQAWGASDPRLTSFTSIQELSKCAVCGERQSDNPQENGCRCFPNLYGSGTSTPFPVQIFRTKNGRNNGLVACCPFERGTAVGEFVGLITKGLDGVDIMQAQADADRYQIWQGREGNHTRFVNHSCRPNSQFQRFVWLGVQRVIMVSRGIEAGAEITVDYSDAYWRNLEKICLCNESCCRFKDRARAGQQS